MEEIYNLGRVGIWLQHLVRIDDRFEGEDVQGGRFRG